MMMLLHPTLSIRMGPLKPPIPNCLGGAISALRGFGEFHIVRGIGKYGKNFTEYLRLMGSGNVGDLRIHNIRRCVTNRMAIGLSTLKLGSKRHGSEDEKNLPLGDFAHVSNGVLGGFMLTDTKAEKNPKSLKLWILSGNVSKTK